MMSFSDRILKNEEKALFSLRELYQSFGYTRFKVGKFEEYDLYAHNKSFLISQSILSFTDTNGKLMALKPDVTLSIVKNIGNDDTATHKLYYNETVYRPSAGSDGFREIMQTGLERIGEIDLPAVGEVLMLAKKSLEKISTDHVLTISHMGFVAGLLETANADEEQVRELLGYVGTKNIPALRAACAAIGAAADFTEAVCSLACLYASLSEALPTVKPLIRNEKMQKAYEELCGVLECLRASGADDRVFVDFSIVNDMNYYNGIIFRGYVNGIPDGILAGGRYDSLLARMGKKSGAIGFAVYLDLLERLDESEPKENAAESGKTMINIALPKGRLGEKAYAIFEKAGYDCPSIKEENRKLVFENPEKGVRYFWVKPSDVVIYVERGAADIGIAGRDIILEYQPDIYELADLGIGKCRMAVACKKDFCDSRDKTLRVATKFTNIARNYYNGISREIDIIKLNGSIELAPILGLSDVIVDIVETGKTLLENDLEPRETIVDISARLVANKVAYKFKNEQIGKLCEDVQTLIRESK